MALAREIPWCILFLSFGAIICHCLVLYGNLQTAGAVSEVGKSVKGWANVGTGLADALQEELDELLNNVTAQLTDAINRTMQTMDMIDALLALMGGSAMNASAVALQQIAFLEGQGTQVDDPFSSVMDTVVSLLSNLPTFDTVLENLQHFMQNLKPALEQVGIWVETFADKVQASVEIFGTTMDKVTNIFDSIMSQISDTVGEGADVMQEETFNLFDTDGSGAISMDDLQNCASIYAVPALQGAKAKDLIEKYDDNGDEEISFGSEFALMVEDESIPGIMATVLRAYAKRLSMVAGNVGAARMRDEVASSVVKYFQLVCSKNLTKVGWVSDMLTNGTLPMAFTADVMAELALQKDDPNVLTTEDVGEIVVGMMMKLNSDYTNKAYELMSSAEHWSTEGFDDEDQAQVVEQVQKWMQKGPDYVKELRKRMVELEKRNEPDVQSEAPYGGGRHGSSLIETDDSEDFGTLSPSEREILAVMDAMPAVARRLAQERMHAHRLQRWRNRSARRLKRFDTDAKRLLLVQLVHGQALSDNNGARDTAEQSLAKGVPAVPETLAFAKWLEANASQTADRFQQECMNYTGEGSSPLDAFNTQIQGMVKKLSQFITLMKKYASPNGIDHLEGLVENFADHGMEDVFKIIGMQLVDVIMNSITSKAKQDTSKSLYGQVNNISMKASRKQHASLFEIEGSASARSAMFHSAAAKFIAMSGKPSPHMDFHVLQDRNNVLNHQMHTQTQLLANSRKYHREWQFKRSNLTRTEFMLRQGPDDPTTPDMSQIWEEVATILHEMEKVLPSAINLLKFARKEVSAVAANLDSIFGMLGKKGMDLFTKVADAYAEMWQEYFVFVFLLNISILIYGFWASGWFGGPAPLVEKDLPHYEPPRSFWDRCKCCCDACCRCCNNLHDNLSCFWLCIILFQVIVLLLFIMALVLSILAGIQMFVGSECVQIYILGDTAVCTDALDKFATFLASFQVGLGEVPLSMACKHHNLQTCDIIHDKMAMAGILTVVGSVLAVIFNFELVFGIAILHERAWWRRAFQEEVDKKEATDEL